MQVHITFCMACSKPQSDWLIPFAWQMKRDLMHADLPTYICSSEYSLKFIVFYYLFEIPLHDAPESHCQMFGKGVIRIFYRIVIHLRGKLMHQIKYVRIICRQWKIEYFICSLKITHNMWQRHRFRVKRKIYFNIEMEK